MLVCRRKDRPDVWWIDFTLRGQRFRVRGFKEKRLTQAVADRLALFIEYNAAGLEPDRHLSEWVASVNERFRTTLANAGLLDRAATLAARPLTVHLENFRQHLVAKGDTPTYVKHTIVTCGSIIRGTCAKSFADLTADRVEQLLADRRATRSRFSAATSNHWLTAIKNFCSWAVKRERCVRNPLASLGKLNVDVDRRLERRVLTLDEFKRLLNSTRGSEPTHGITGPERYLLYAFAATTGFRANECRMLTVESFDLDRKTPMARLPARASKRKRPDACPWLPAWLVGLLREQFRDKLPGVAAFRMPAPWAVSIMFEHDLTAAGLDYRTRPTPDHPYGLTFDFHALRHMFSTHAGAAVQNAKDLQEVLRVSTMGLVSRYTHANQDRIRERMANMPDLSVAG